MLSIWRVFSIICRLKLKALHRFTSTATAVEDITALQNGKIGKGLKKFLTDEVLGKGKGKDAQQQLVVVDPHLGQFNRWLEGLHPTDIVADHLSTFYLEKAQHQCQVFHNRKHWALERYTKSVGCVTRWVGPQRLGDNELRSQSFTISVSAKEICPKDVDGAFLIFIFRFKLKFSPDKVDTMIVQAIALLDDLDKEINIYSMRVKVN